MTDSPSERVVNLKHPNHDTPNNEAHDTSTIEDDDKSASFCEPVVQISHDENKSHVGEDGAVDLGGDGGKEFSKELPTAHDTSSIEDDDKSASFCEPAVQISHDENKSRVGEDGAVGLGGDGGEELSKELPTAHDTSTIEDDDASASFREPAVQISHDETKSCVGEDVAVDLGGDGSEELSKELPTDDPGKEDLGIQDIAPLRSPLKRARTAYFIFMGEMRPQVIADYPSEGIGSTARRIGQLWAALTPQQKEKYKIQSADEREKYNEAKSKLGPDPSEKNKSLKRPIDEEGACILPLARIRKICRLDPEVRSISKEGLLLITKAAECFTQKLGSHANAMAHIQKRRTLLPADILDVCSLKAPFFFLKDDIQDLMKEQSADKKNEKLNAKKDTKQTPEKSRISGVKPLTSYFKLK